MKNSDQSIQTNVIDKALEVSKPVESEALSVLEDDALGFPEINEEVDIYDADAKEMLILVDEISVSIQSESRVSSKKASVDIESDTESDTKNDNKSAGIRVNSNIVLL